MVQDRLSCYCIGGGLFLKEHLLLYINTVVALAISDMLPCRTPPAATTPAPAAVDHGQGHKIIANRLGSSLSKQNIFGMFAFTGTHSKVSIRS